MLDRRPDLKSSELKIVAANANIGIAIADLFPDLLMLLHHHKYLSRTHQFFVKVNFLGGIFVSSRPI